MRVTVRVSLIPALFLHVSGRRASFVFSTRDAILLTVGIRLEEDSLEEEEIILINLMQ